MTYIYRNKNIITILICLILFVLIGLFYLKITYAEIQTNTVTTETINPVNKNILDASKGNIGDTQSKPKEIVADLYNMKIYTYENGVMTREMNIVSKGKPENYYATPVGDYKILLKEKSHFSSIGHVYMPYSMQFFGNFFIHGIPYYPDGTRVTTAYSGGCIRLEDMDAKYIYEFAEKDTPLIINNINKTAPNIEISDQKFVKIMNALIALENVNMNDNNLETVRNMIQNENDTDATYLARQIGSSFFLKQMNNKAIAIGLYDTNFIDIQNKVTTTEQDKQKLIQYLYNNKSYLYNLTFN